MLLLPKDMSNLSVPKQVMKKHVNSLPYDSFNQGNVPELKNLSAVFKNKNEIKSNRPRCNSLRRERKPSRNLSENSSYFLETQSQRGDEEANTELRFQCELKGIQGLLQVANSTNMSINITEVDSSITLRNGAIKKLVVSIKQID